MSIILNIGHDPMGEEKTHRMDIKIGVPTYFRYVHDQIEKPVIFIYPLMCTTFTPVFRWKIIK